VNILSGRNTEFQIVYVYEQARWQLKVVDEQHMLHNIPMYYHSASDKGDDELIKCIGASLCLMMNLYF
jgi:hypothetical protein